MFLSIGALIIDHIRYEPPLPYVAEDAWYLGGAGIYALYGMRCWASPSSFSSKLLHYIALLGHSSPIDIPSQYLTPLTISLCTIHIPRPQPRAVNVLHTDTGVRDFYFETSEQDYTQYFRLQPHHVPTLLLEKELYVHVISSHQCKQAYYFWEPSPGCCVSREFDDFLRAVPFATMTSPNHYELAALIGSDRIQAFHRDHPHFDVSLMNIQLPTNKNISDYQDPLVLLAILEQAFIQRNMTANIVVRAGEKGCLYMNPQFRITVLPAYWDIFKEPQRVVDVTGAGNSFMGGLAVGYKVSLGNGLLACLYATISASLTVEQMGLPILDAQQDTWNQGVQPYQRLQAYKVELRKLGLVLQEE